MPEETLVNLTPHDLSINGEKWSPHVRGGLRVESTVNELPTMDVKAPNGKVIKVKLCDAPKYSQDMTPDISFLSFQNVVVSQICADVILQHDLFPGTGIYVPNTQPGSVERDDKGNITGVKGLIQMRPSKKRPRE